MRAACFPHRPIPSLANDLLLQPQEGQRKQTMEEKEEWVTFFPSGKDWGMALQGLTEVGVITEQWMQVLV